MNTQELARRLEEAGIEPDAYDLNGNDRSECYVLLREIIGWSVYYSERGSRTESKRFLTESAACEYLLSRLIREA